MVMMVRENMKGDMGGRGPGKTRDDNKAGFKQHDDGNKKDGKGGKKK